MAGEWVSVTLREAGVTLIDCDHRTPPAATSGYPYVAIPQLKEGRLALSDVRRISEEHFVEWTRKAKPRCHDVILSRRCNPGETAYVPEGIECALGQNLVLLRADGKGLYPPFLRWLVRGPDWWEQVGTFINVGAVFESLRCADIPNFKLPIPPVSIQRDIAHVLGTLDDLIELNREANELLEEMARALFKSWFVDFDPVRAKLEGRAPASMDAATAALFPDHFQDSELGQIPKGWKAGKVGDLATLGRVAVNPGRHPEEFFDHYSLPAFDDGRNPKTEVGSAIMSNKFLVEPDAVLLSKLNPHIPRVWLPDLDAGRRSVCSTEFMVARAASGVSREYLFSLFTDPYFASIYGTLVSGTTGSHQRISPDSLIAMQVIAPPDEVIKAFTAMVKPMFDTTHSNLRESRDLAALRDTLLPKLLSGEISVPAAEELIAASA
jgi:type I restriction enzyme S subunit